VFFAIVFLHRQARAEPTEQAEAALSSI